MKRADVTAATKALQHHRVEWFPPSPPHSRKPTFLCMGCGWTVEIDGYFTDDPRGLEHRMEHALAEVGLAENTEKGDPR